MTSKYCRHIFNTRHQYTQVRQMKLGLKENAMIHCDFSENYAVKYNSEVQSVHFGVSNAQVTLHTGILYTEGQVTGFATISDCRKHDPPAIWAHLKQIFEYASVNYPAVHSVNFVSDGPTTQYRSKNNFFHLSTKPFEWGMRYINWSFLEAGHGKGAADGMAAF